MLGPEIQGRIYTVHLRARLEHLTRNLTMKETSHGLMSLSNSHLSSSEVPAHASEFNVPFTALHLGGKPAAHRPLGHLMPSLRAESLLTDLHIPKRPTHESRKFSDAQRTGLAAFLSNDSAYLRLCYAYVGLRLVSLGWERAESQKTIATHRPCHGYTRTPLRDR